jgi:GT2 family glycosyltransferase
VTRPPVDVVVPFAGTPTELEEVRRRLARLELCHDDTIVVVDNTPGHGPAGAGAVPVINAVEYPTPPYARNRGAERGSAEWVLFLDADVVPPPDLLDLYFEQPPSDQSALLAGGVVDEPVPPSGPPAARYNHLRRSMSQDLTFGYGPRWGFALTANLAVRRAAFQAVGGFRDHIFNGEDADLTYRLREAGWKVERRERAAVVHLSRRSARAFVRQKAIHGSAAAWLNEHYPGSFLPRGRAGLVWWALRFTTTGLVQAALKRDRDLAILKVFDAMENLAYEFGRSRSNERPRTGYG